MKALPLLDDASAEVLGFEWLTAAVAPASAYGERRFSELRPFVAGEEVAAQVRADRIAAAGRDFDADRLAAVRVALGGVPDALGAIARASIGDVLADPSFFELRLFCGVVERLDGLLAASTVFEPLSNDGVREVGRALGRGQRGDVEFYLTDEFDAELATARTRLSRAQAELDAARGREGERAASALGREELGGDEFIVMRTDVPAALPQGVRIVREAPTYLLCTLDYGDAALAALERRDAAARGVADAQERVRAALSSLVKDRAAELLRAANALGELDVLIAAASFTQRYRCVAAAIGSDAEVVLAQARYLPLEAELEAVGRSYTPLELELRDAAVLTGPNMGGKSVALLTCGFAALCAAFGLPVPAAHARIGLFDQIAWLGLGREAHIGGLLSSFAQEVLALKEILTRDASRLLILVDEFARTTTAHEGKALLVALLARLRERNARALVATHLEGLAAAAGVRHLAVRGLRGVPAPPQTDDVGEALEALAGSMDYRVAEVGEDASVRADAIALTALLGIDRRFVEAAYRALSQ